jgi:UDP-N-acetylmuramoyl-L-alanyl-D-glutamate--2,6-diaminopimelate ligase
MEVSSHGLQLGRTWGCAFDVAAFSNLTQDHLDFHGDMESYLQAKLLLFRRHLDTGGTAVINLDGAGSEAVVRCAHERGDLRVLGCSRASQAAPVRLCDLTEEITGLSGTLIFPSDERVTFRSKLVGSFNADNILLAAGCAYAGDIPAQAIAAGVDRLSGVPGRLERVPSDPDRSVFVDYAHTPDALARALDVLRPLCSGRLIVVFGCGGDRDRAKRPRMGEAAAERADLVLVTSDNPRSEDPHDILAQIVPGVAHRLPRLTSEALDKRGVRGYLTEPDRASAIDTAVGLLGSGDVLLIAGKGHENYQLIGAQRLDFDDRQQARVALARHHEAGRVRPPRRSR